ncbi:peptidase U32 family protein [endosymbiont 'TC1' of Trimyema compressum]|uniref:peptidase U32 family protein n=1 Tax=endosymbiont 'TC1' of Trimyema compressum TaxID=243899 RepID=UPI000B4C9264|nr:U32 family peptidase [endosymbiont 'TC1' of Trimyema compressum]
MDWLSQIGIDGVIVQDVGLMNLVLKYCPEMDVHTSTQMTIANIETITYLKNIGVKRVVVPRESSLADIKVLSEGGLELEAFVHGAICISYSGQCLLSSMIGGRSGNKGACAQPCRLTYNLYLGIKK